MIENIENNKRTLTEIIFYPIRLVALLFGIHFLHFIVDLDGWGIYPRDLDGVKGIFLGPLVHASWEHLFNNCVPLFALSSLIVYFYPRVAFRGFAMIYFVTGLLVWLFAKGNTFHIGISGVVYGLVTFVFWNGIFRRSMRSVVLSLLILSLYSGMFAGILPDQPGVSWESHLFGALVGIAASFYYRGELELEEEIEFAKPVRVPEVPYAQRPYFFERDTFEYTKTERLRMQAEEAERQHQQAILEQEEYMQQQLLQQQLSQPQNTPEQRGFWNSSTTWE